MHQSRDAQTSYSITHTHIHTLSFSLSPSLLCVSPLMSAATATAHSMHTPQKVHSKYSTLRTLRRTRRSPSLKERDCMASAIVASRNRSCPSCSAGRSPAGRSLAARHGMRLRHALTLNSRKPLKRKGGKITRKEKSIRRRKLRIVLCQ